jgi:hypothetical protein
MAHSRLLVLAVFLAVFPLTAQKWQLRAYGAGVWEDAGNNRITVIEQKEAWTVGEIPGKLGPNRYFGVWIQGPRPVTFKNAFGTALLGYKFRVTEPGKPTPEFPTSYSSFNEDGTATRALAIGQGPAQQGTWKVEFWVHNRETVKDMPAGIVTFQIVP